MGTGTPPVILPGQSVSIEFHAGAGQALSFATMYGWSNDLFFAPENPGINLYNADGTPVTGDVSSQIKLWDNGTRINQAPGMSVMHPGTAESTPKNISEVNGTDAQGNMYLAASQLMKATLAYHGNSRFTLTLKNTSGGTANETPFSPGVWTVSYAPGGDILDKTPIYAEGQPSVNGLTNIAEMGDNSVLDDHLQGMTGIFTPLSPVLVVVYSGDENPFYKTGEKDRGEGLSDLAQTGNAEILAGNLESKSGVKKVYVLKEPSSTVLLPKAGGASGGKVMQQLDVVKGDRIALATMYGLSNDWFYATKGNGIDAMKKGDVSDQISLYDNGTKKDQYPGANIRMDLPGMSLRESKVIEEVPNPNAFTTLPQIVKVTLN
ncbi:spondin domain-containing protein [Sphingobacterium endophyticum]|uniref:spondin domain-containing protein n=1 Tax=Sphingobacterium endophyticum TaxID=2546448 RepID=UPI001E451A77|nr:spondin domain-containing protein [Sphingobacterium endophyticum]